MRLLKYLAAGAVIAAFALSIRVNLVEFSGYYEYKILPNVRAVLSLVLLFFIFYAILFDLCIPAVGRAYFPKNGLRKPFAHEIYREVAKRFFLALAGVLFIDAGLRIVLLIIEEPIRARTIIQTLVMGIGGITLVAMHRGLEYLVEPMLEKDGKLEIDKYKIVLFAFLTVTVAVLTGLAVVLNFVTS